MYRRFAAALALLVLFSLAFCTRESYARSVTVNVPDTGCITVRHLSVPGGNAVLDTFQAASFDSVQGSIWSFSGSCNTPPPPVDPGAYTSAVVTWMTHQQTVGATDVTRFANLFGRTGFNTPLVPLGWTYANGTTVRLPDQTDKGYRLRLDMPMNPGTLSHFIKLDSYSTTVAGVRIAVVAPGAPWPTGDATPCYVPRAVNNQPAININPGPFNRTKCSVAPGTSVDVLVDSIGNARGTIGLSWN